MMLGTYTTLDGYVLEAFSTLYMDWGLRITAPTGDQVFYNPSCLSNDSYGRKPNPDQYDDWCMAEQAEQEGNDGAFVPWEEADWIEALKAEADDFIEAYVGDN